LKTILIAGGSGLVGTRITQLLDPEQYHINILTRSPRPPKGNITYHHWDIEKGIIDDHALDADYLINLTGAGIADSRWTDSRKKLLIDSRVNSTLLIQSAMKKAKRRFKAAVSASAIGYYGDQGDTILDEDGNPGDEHLLENETNHTVFNGVAPRPLTNKKFTEEVRDGAGGGIVLPAPAFGLKLALGEMSKVVLNSNRVIPQNFTKEEFKYKFTDLADAVKDLIKRKV